MLAKLLALLSTTKGAAAAGVVAAAAVGTGVTATNDDVQNAIGTAVESITIQLESSNKPAVVAARNEADRELRAAFQEDQQKLEKLHGTMVDSAERAKLTEMVNTAATALRERLNKALDDVAVLTLGREGLTRDPGKPEGSPDIKVAFTAETQAKLDEIVETATLDMDKIVSDTESAVAALPTFTPGKPADVTGGQPADTTGTKPADAPSGKPASVPTPPARPTP